MTDPEMPRKEEVLEVLSAQAKHLDRVFERYATTSDRLCRDMTAMQALLHLEFDDLRKVDEEVGHELARLDANTSVAIEILKRTEKEQNAFQTRFSSTLVESANTRIEAFKLSAAYLEKVSLLGVASFGLTVTLFGVMSSQTTAQAPLQKLSYSIFGWVCIIASIIAATLTHNLFNKMSHEALNHLATSIGKWSLHESAEIYKQPIERFTEPSPARKPVEDSDSISGLHLQSRRLLRISDLATFLIICGFILFLLFIKANTQAFSSLGASH